MVCASRLCTDVVVDRKSLTRTLLKFVMKLTLAFLFPFWSRHPSFLVQADVQAKDKLSAALKERLDASDKRTRDLETKLAAATADAAALRERLMDTERGQEVCVVLHSWSA